MEKRPVGRPPKKDKSVPQMVYWPPQLHDDLSKQAEKEKLSFSELVVDLVSKKSKTKR